MKAIMAAISLSWALSAQAIPEGPQQVVEGIFQMASAPEIATDAKKQASVTELVDFKRLAKAALGTNKVAPKEFEWFQNTLQEIITRTVYPKAPGFLKDVKITYGKAVTAGDSTTINSTVQNKADFTDVNYKLEKSDGQNWRVVDVSISGLSWVESIREQVNSTIKKKKWQGLKDSMGKRLANIKAGKI